MRTKKVALNAFFSAVNLLVPSLLSMLVTREILFYLGSDYNGLNSIIANFLTILTLLESGFVLATQVMLYKPFGEQNFAEVNRILSRAQKDFFRIGILVFALGVVGSAIYACFIKTEVDYSVVLTLFLFSVVSTAFSFCYSYKYRLLYQVSQTEYVVHIINILFSFVTYGGTFVLVRLTKSILFARGYQMLCSIAAALIIGLVARKRFPFVSFHEDTTGVVIEGTKDLLVSKVTVLLYNNLTVFYMSIFVGTMYTSVYAVYNTVVNLITVYLHSVLSAPQNALGQVIHQEKDRFKKIFAECEYATVVLSCILFSTTMVLLIPFVRIYTRNITDINYIMPELGLIMVLTSLLQLVHIPSGQCIELCGRFKVVKRIQMMAIGCLVVFSSIGVKLYGFVGLLLAKLATNIVLATAEIVYTHTRIAENTLGGFAKLLLGNGLFVAAFSVVEYLLLWQFEISFIQFFLCGIVVLPLNAGLVLLFNFLFFRENTRNLLHRVKILFGSRLNRGKTA